MGMNMTNGLWNQSCLTQKRQLKTVKQGVRVETYKKGGWNPILTVQNIYLNFKEQMSSQTTNNYLTALTSPNPYITRKLNNMDKAQAIKAEWDDWMRLYHKMLKGLEAMIDI